MNKKKEKELKRYRALIGDRKMYEYAKEQKNQPITKEMAELCRHRLEKRWYRRLVVLNFLVIAFVLGLFFINLPKNYGLANDYIEQVKGEVKDTIEDFKNISDEETDKSDIDDEKTDKDKIDEAPFEVKYFFMGVVILGVGYLALYYLYAANRASALRITEKNFPDVYKTIEEYANRLGIAVPKAYVMQGSGVLNAFSTFLFKRQWILINSEMFEVAYREYQDMEALNFVIAHEMAHIYYGHATLHYNLLMWFTMNIPILGSTASRAREYSCDRLAQLLTGESGIDSMLLIVVDRHLYKLVDQEDYINEMKSIKGFFLWWANLIVDHPVISKRVVALDEGAGSGALY